MTYLFIYFFKFPPLPAKAQVTVSAKAHKQLGECSTFIRIQSERPLFYIHVSLLIFFPPAALVQVSLL